MSSRFIVSARCPTCDGDLDFSEGTNSIQCRFCKSNLLVTGKKQTLSYFIAPRLIINRAVAKALLAHKSDRQRCRVIHPQLYFIPYYRLTGHDLRWEKTSKESRYRSRPIADLENFFKDNSEFESDSAFSSDHLMNKLLKNFFSTSSPRPYSPHQTKTFDTGDIGADESSHHDLLRNSKGWRDSSIRAVFHDRYVEKNFVACNLLRGRGMYSLGVRASVLKLELFQQNTVESLGKIVRPDITPKEAFSHGMKTARAQHLLYRRVLGQVLSVVYFPYWIVEMRRGGKSFLTIVDAVSENVTIREAPTDLQKSLNTDGEHAPQVIGFRPLVCPNCGWDLPIRKDDAIFFCSSCEKPWQIYGKDLYEVKYQVAGRIDSPSSYRVRYLPFWILDITMKETSPQRFFLPAFRYARLKALTDLARALTQRQPRFSAIVEKIPDLYGCFYDQEDAVKLAHFTYIGMSRKHRDAIQTLQNQEYKIRHITLTWLPFKEKGLSLIDPISGLGFPRNLLK